LSNQHENAVLVLVVALVLHCLIENEDAEDEDDGSPIHRSRLRHYGTSAL
jgi:hypothetical protein